jgi:hypothetical protein
VPVDFYNGACSAALAGRADDAFGFLDRALAAGYAAYDQVMADSDLASLRADARWPSFATRIKAAQDEQQKLLRSLPAFYLQLNRIDSVGYLVPHLALERMLIDYANAPTEWLGAVSEVASWVRAIVGDPAGADSLADKYITAEPRKVADGLEHFKPRDAVAEIARAAKNTRIVMINEAHHVPLTRMLTADMLHALYAEGYRYFAVEAVSNADTLNAKGYAIGRTGMYAREPVFGDMLRNARRIGFQIVPYDTFSPGCQATAEDPSRCFTARDSLAAARLYRGTFAKDPNAKVLVHAGYSHVMEKSASAKALAFWLSRMTGIDPLTVDQTEMRGHADAGVEEPEYARAISNGWLNRRPIVLRNTNGTWFVNAGGSFAGVDMQVFTPRATYADGRPDWLFSRGGRRHVPFKLSLPDNARGPFLVEAFNDAEPDWAVPADRLVTPDVAPETVTLALRKGTFRVRITDEAGTVVTRKVTVK